MHIGLFLKFLLNFLNFFIIEFIISSHIIIMLKYPVLVILNGIQSFKYFTQSR